MERAQLSTPSHQALALATFRAHTAPGTVLAMPSPLGGISWRWYVHGCACAPGLVARWHESENEAQLCAMRVKVDAVLGQAVDVPLMSGGAD